MGTATFLTDINGNAYSFFLNLPFGETQAEQQSITNSFATPYKFTGKELDDETGLYYFGARYYDPKTSIWLSVDPLAEKYAFASPYNYCLNNPSMFTDPDGRSVDGDYYDSKGNHIGKDKINDNKIYVADSVTKDAAGYVTSAANSIDLTKDYGITHSQVLDRANWIYAEGGGDFPQYYAFAMNNFKDKAGSEKDMYKYGMQDTDPATGKVIRLDKEIYFSGGYENKGGIIFWNARKNLSTLTDKMKATIASVFQTQLNPILDPTNGCNQWRGGKGSGAVQLTDDGIYWHRFFKMENKYSGQAPIIDTRTKKK